MEVGEDLVVQEKEQEMTEVEDLVQDVLVEVVEEDLEVLVEVEIQGVKVLVEKEVIFKDQEIGKDNIKLLEFFKVRFHIS